MAAQTVPNNAEKNRVRYISDCAEQQQEKNKDKIKKKTEKGCPINRPINRCNIGCVCCILAYI